LDFRHQVWVVAEIAIIWLPRGGKDCYRGWVPSPFGHLLAGLATAWVAGMLPPLRFGPQDSTSAGDAPLTQAGLAATCALLAVAPDVDIVLTTHRAFTHSIAATGLVGLAASAVAWRRRWPVAPIGMACAAAYGSHVLLDWLGHDSSVPTGIMALWPVSHAYFVSGLDLFADVSRRYWLPTEFFAKNAVSVAREVLILGPLAYLAWAVHRRTRRV
jgi:membrane-bound metal-dependent hydrolase YbcI (DUF457 family)